MWLTMKLHVYNMNQALGSIPDTHMHAPEFIIGKRKKKEYHLLLVIFFLKMIYDFSCMIRSELLSLSLVPGLVIS